MIGSCIGLRARDKNQVSNYHTIIVRSTTAKIYSIIIEQKVSAWVQSQNKRKFGQAGFILASYMPTKN